MKNIIVLRNIQSNRLNNDEYINFIRNVEKLIQIATIEKLSIEQQDFLEFQESIEQLLAIDKYNKENHLTEEIASLDKQRGELSLFLLSMCRAERKNPDTKRSNAASYLYKEIKSFSGIQNLPIGQQTSATERLLVLLSDSTNQSHITTLGLSDVVNKLSKVNKKFQEIAANRSESQLSKRKGSVRSVRKITDAQYQNLMAYAFATNILHETEESKNFVQRINKLISDVISSYKQRKAISASLYKSEKIVTI